MLIETITIQVKHKIGSWVLQHTIKLAIQHLILQHKQYQLTFIM